MPPLTSPFCPTTSHGPSAYRLIGKAVFHFNSKDIAQGLIPPPFHFVHNAFPLCHREESPGQRQAPLHEQRPRIVPVTNGSSPMLPFTLSAAPPLFSEPPPLSPLCPTSARGPIACRLLAATSFPFVHHIAVLPSHRQESHLPRGVSLFLKAARYSDHPRPHPHRRV